MFSYFVKEVCAGQEILRPTQLARNGWGVGRIRGPAVTGVLARAAERAVQTRADLGPVRATFELFSPARMETSTTTSTIVRESRRLLLVDTELIQASRVVARAHILYLAGSAANPRGALWAPSCPPPAPPPAELRPCTGERRLYYSDGVGWTSSRTAHLNPARKQVWQLPIPVVLGEPLSAFQAAASAADLANLILSWGSAGIEYINADVTMAISRPPVGSGVGLSSIDRVARNGIAVGSAILFDANGSFGSATVSTLANFPPPEEQVAQLSDARRVDHRDCPQLG
ncbi:acyl-CoA thioesterase domain-containing protein [Rhodococcus sp. T2V]|uniref:acyl-CoA thioesterase domain-containing protein n=1 Tax=Rhodococcus sp. T2V TaxID=3034164 RepID=UPI0034E2EBAD